MNRKLLRLLQPGMRLYFIVLVIFAAATFFANVYLAAVEFFIVAMLLVYSRVTVRSKRRELKNYIESVSYSLDSETKDTLLSFPLPMVILNPGSCEVLWTNESFKALTGGRDHMFEESLTDTIPGFSGRWLLEGKNESPEPVEMDGRLYRVYGSLLRSGPGNGAVGLLATTCWVDVTEAVNILNEYAQSKPVTAVIMLDNYDELLGSLSETQKSAVLAAIDDKVSAWTGDTSGYLSKYDRDRYVFIFEERFLPGFVEGKFSLLDSIRDIVSPSGVTASLSIGIGKGGGSFAENFRYALLGIEMALSRGGDQAVLKNRYNFEFYGGRSKELEKRTKVKSRVMASALGGLMSDASRILIMGHRKADFDSVGAAAGLCCIARKLGKKPGIVIDLEDNVSETLIRKLSVLPEYEGVFMTPQDAILLADSKTLLIVVDTNRPDQVQSEELLESCNRLAVIDHHRRAAQYIGNADLNFHEPYASSACELVAELVQYLAEQPDILRHEAEAMLAGIMLDTKNFTVRTGGRTFEAAAFLRRTGADTTEVKKLLQNDLKSTVARYNIIQRAKLFRKGVAIAALDTEVDRIIAAQAADELLNIQGIDCSFVLFPDGSATVVSARSIGDVNVQVVLESVGGGGNKATAGVQINDKNVKTVLAELMVVLDNYLGKK